MSGIEIFTPPPICGNLSNSLNRTNLIPKLNSGNHLTLLRFQTTLVGAVSIPMETMANAYPTLTFPSSIESKPAIPWGAYWQKAFASYVMIVTLICIFLWMCCFFTTKLEIQGAGGGISGEWEVGSGKWGVGSGKWEVTLWVRDQSHKLRSSHQQQIPVNKAGESYHLELYQVACSTALLFDRSRLQIRCAQQEPLLGGSARQAVIAECQLQYSSFSPIVAAVVGMGHYLANIHPLLVIMDNGRYPITVSTHIEYRKTIHVVR